MIEEFISGLKIVIPMVSGILMMTAMILLGIYRQITDVNDPNSVAASLQRIAVALEKIENP